ncbi:MAG: hypothetical protein IT361_18730 [Gemmatimonadaceae bacterium]|nr:hypothetical protein [Gemmatimonadaceae bacterium]
MSTPFAEDEFLTLRVGGDAATPERLLLIGRPRDGRVRIREWTSNTLNTAGADHDLPAAELLAGIEQAYASRRPVSEEMYRIRSWLGA